MAIIGGIGSTDLDARGYTLSNVALIRAGDIYVTGDVYRNGTHLRCNNQSDVTGSRVANVVYQNTVDKAMFVNICWNLQGKTSALSFYSDSNNPPTTLVAQVSDTNPSPVVVQLFGMVLGGNYYMCQVGAAGVTLVSWVEYT